MTDVDVTAAEALRGLKQELEQQGVAMKFAHANRPLRKVLERIGFTGELGQGSFFSSVHECVTAFQASARHAARAPLLHRQSPTQTIVGDDVRSL